MAVWAPGVWGAGVWAAGVWADSSPSTSVWAPGVWGNCVWADGVWFGMDGCGVHAPAGQYPKPAGRRQRKKYQIGEQTYALTEDELQAMLSVVMAREPIKSLPKPARRPAKVLQKAAQAAPEIEPTYEAAPAFDALWADLMRRKDHETATLAREIAERLQLESDDEEIFLILSAIDDD